LLRKSRIRKENRLHSERKKMEMEKEKKKKKKRRKEEKKKEKFFFLSLLRSLSLYYFTSLCFSRL